MLKENEKWEICCECGGEGTRDVGDACDVPCPDCGGTGKVLINLDSLEGPFGDDED